MTPDDLSPNRVLKVLSGCGFRVARQPSSGFNVAQQPSCSAAFLKVCPAAQPHF